MHKYYLFFFPLVLQLFGSENNLPKKYEVSFFTVNIEPASYSLAYYQDKELKIFQTDDTNFSAEQRFYGSKIDFLKVITDSQITNNPRNIESTKNLELLNKSIEAEQKATQSLIEYNNFNEYISTKGNQITTTERLKLEYLKNESDRFSKISAELKSNYYAKAGELSKLNLNPKTERFDNSNVSLKPKSVIQTEPFCSFVFNESDKYIFIFYKLKDEHKVNAISGNEKVFPFGSWYFINTTGFPIEIKINRNSLKLSPGQRGLIYPTQSQDNKINTQISYLFENNCLPGITFSRFLNSSCRSLFIIKQASSNPITFDLKSFDDFKPIISESTVPKPSEIKKVK